MADYLASLTAFESLARQRLLPQAGAHRAAHSSAAAVSKPAAVLIPVVAREVGLTVLLTQRSKELPSHAGQIAFPGGKIDQKDTSPLAAALRETREETGIAEEFVQPVGYLKTYETGTGFSVVPVVGVLRPGFDLVPEPGEVSEIFEVPLGFLMDPSNHQRKQAMWQGRMREYHAMPYEGRYIWGATAAMLVDLSQRLGGFGGDGGDQAWSK